MLQKMGNLLLVLSHADTAVKGHLCRQDTLLSQFELMQAAQPELLLKLLKSLKHVTLDPSTLPALQVIASAFFSPGNLCPCSLAVARSALEGLAEVYLHSHRCCKSN